MSQPLDFIDSQQFEALMWFWLPLALVPVGVWLMLERENSTLRKLGLPVSTIGFIMVIASQWTVPESDSSASGQLLLSVIGPIILIALGSFLSIFGSPVPVGRLPSIARPIGYISIVIALCWLFAMHMISPPLWRGEVNPYWKIWWAAFLLSMCLVGMILAQMILFFGDKRGKTALEIGFFSLISTIIIVVLMLNDGAQITASEMRAQIWLAIADIIGTMSGILMAVLAFAVVITLYERSLSEMKPTEPLNKEERQRVSEILADNVGGESNEN